VVAWRDQLSLLNERRDLVRQSHELISQRRISLAPRRNFQKLYDDPLQALAHLPCQPISIRHCTHVVCASSNVPVYISGNPMSDQGISCRFGAYLWPAGGVLAYFEKAVADCRAVESRRCGTQFGALASAAIQRFVRSSAKRISWLRPLKTWCADVRNETLRSECTLQRCHLFLTVYLYRSATHGCHGNDIKYSGNP
jgi:hypothetical protein